MKWIVLIKFILDLISQLPLDQRNEGRVLELVQAMVPSDNSLAAMGVTTQGWADLDWAAIIKKAFEIIHLLKPVLSPPNASI